MSRDLDTFRRHARRMAESTPESRVTAEWSPGRETVMPVGAMSEADRALWRMLADEGDRFAAQEALDGEPDRTPTEDDVPLI